MTKNGWSDEGINLLDEVQKINERNMQIKQNLLELTSLVNQNQMKLDKLKESILNLEVKKNDLPNEKIIKFNIGGTPFSCFLSTIVKKIKKPNSDHFYEPNILEAIVNGDVATKYDEENRYFIERSPKYFDYVLSYLRTANTEEHLNLPKTKIFLKDLLEEARFYNVKGLKQMVKEINNKIVEQNSFKAVQSKDLSKVNMFKSIESKHMLKLNNYAENHLKKNETQRGKKIGSVNLSSSDLDRNERKYSSEDSFRELQNKLPVNFEKSEMVLNQSINTPNLEVKSINPTRKFLSEFSYSAIKDTNQCENYSFFANCVISFMHPECFFIQKPDFDEELKKIQPEIDDCLDSYDSKLSPLCIGQWREDNLFYRCRILNWFQKTNEAECLFIDFGNIELVSIDTITKMSDSLQKVKSLAICCKLKNEISPDSEEFHELRKLVFNTRFDVRVRTDDLEKFNSIEIQDFNPITVELCTSTNKIYVNKENLANKRL